MSDRGPRVKRHSSGGRPRAASRHSATTTASNAVTMALCSSQHVAAYTNLDLLSLRVLQTEDAVLEPFNGVPDASHFSQQFTGAPEH
jgi:hypothetical protein